MNVVCIFGELQDMDANQALMDTLNGDIQILQLAEDCYWTIVAFSLAHEIAHIWRLLVRNTPRNIQKRKNMMLT